MSFLGDVSRDGLVCSGEGDRICGWRALAFFVGDIRSPSRSRLAAAGREGLAAVLASESVRGGEVGEGGDSVEIEGGDSLWVEVRESSREEQDFSSVIDGRLVDDIFGGLT